VAAVELFVGVDHALGRPAETLALRIIAGERKQRADGRFGLLTRGPCRCRRGASDMVGKLRFAQRLDDSIHNGLSVRPAPKPGAGGGTGAAATVIAAGGEDPWRAVRRRMSVFTVPPGGGKRTRPVK